MTASGSIKSLSILGKLHDMPKKAKQAYTTSKLAIALVNAMVLIVGIYGFLLFGLGVDHYFVSVQEDEYLEWASFWAFFIAGVLYIRLATQPKFVWGENWFVIGLSLFCFFVAFEEISWRQRIFGYRPPEYFLATNFQQEFNIHNIAGSSVRSFGMYLILFGYGVLLPLSMQLKPLKQLAGRFSILPPPMEILPAFLATGIFWWSYPFLMVAEWVEMMVGLCFLFSAMLTLSKSHDPPLAQPSCIYRSVGSRYSVRISQFSIFTVS